MLRNQIIETVLTGISQVLDKDTEAILSIDSQRGQYILMSDADSFLPS